MGGLIATQLRKGGYMKYLILSDTVANKEKVKAKKQEWYRKNKERILEQQKEYRNDPKTEYSKKRKENYNKEKKREQNKKYYEKNREQILLRQNIRRKK